MKPWIRGLSVGAGLLAASAAWADPPQGVLDPSVPEFSNTFSVGGGVLGFVGLEHEPTFAKATTWLVRYGFTPATPVTWEFAYVGAMDVTPPDSIDRDTAFLTLVDLDLRVNIVPLADAYPFIAGGVGYGVYERTTTDGAGGIDYTTFSVPLAAGVEMLLGEVSVESRVQYRPTFLDEDVHFTRSGGDTWAWTASVGARF